MYIFPVEINSKIVICLSEKDIPHFAMQFPGLGMDQNLWAWLFNLVALADLHSVGLVLLQQQIKIYWESHFRKLLNLLHHLSLPPLLTPLTSSQLHSTYSLHLFPAKTLSNKSGTYSARNAKTGHWLLVLTGQNILFEITWFQEKKPNKTFPVVTRNSLCTCLSFLGLEADKLIFLLSESPTTCLCAFFFTSKWSHCFLSTL